jgi:TatD DNase family protein
MCPRSKSLAKLAQFFNFHTHTSSQNPKEKSIYNLLIQDADEFENLQNNWISVGIHPWYTDAENWKEQLQIVEKTAVNECVLAIGECGLDRLIELPLDTQLMIFEAQVAVAERFQKPVIIHCVRAFSELLQWKKQKKQTVPLIVHGFNNKPEMARQLVAHGFYFSLGTALLQSNSNAVKVLKMIPVTRLFLETDDKDMSIVKVYEAAALHLEMTVCALKNQIWTNFATVFKR